MAQDYDIRVEARPFYLEEQSDLVAGRYAFAYRITIANEGTVAAQLLSRHWIIEEADGKRQEVRGPGVVGETPNLAPGDIYEYTSGVTLATPFGSMRGSYRMRAADGTEFDAEIPAFILSMPRTLH